ncbi:hypothetical protein GE061_008258 [Apolygus lucorum]|uniref:Uncharacterized protein n=1 Tax=Apolygus lucorum TaxID=248454 RepID=A0A8S9WNF8_APOLU|nr:hypothetical protein GE061_008258 [Apolygus lucorum]
MWIAYLSFVLLVGGAAAAMPTEESVRSASNFLLSVFKTLISDYWKSLSRMMCSMASGKLKAIFLNMKNIFGQLIQRKWSSNPPYINKRISNFSFRNQNVSEEAHQKNKSDLGVTKVSSSKGPGERRYFQKYPIHYIPYTLPPNTPSPPTQYRPVVKHINEKNKGKSHWPQYANRQR